jgi:hypothetical protein
MSDKNLNSISIRQEFRKDLGDLGGLGGENLRALTLEGPFGVVAEGAARKLTAHPGGYRMQDAGPPTHPSLPADDADRRRYS